MDERKILRRLSIMLNVSEGNIPKTILKYKKQIENMKRELK
ncbi:MAG: hypothetical protein ACTSVB_06945 [Candidatus Heimdallarchaeaceae archaeon]